MDCLYLEQLNMKSDVDCLIIGGGPTGLTLGIGLVKAGKSCIIAEKHLTSLGFSRALLVSSDSLQLLEPYGVTRVLQKTGTPLDGFSCFVDEQLVSSSQFDTTLAYHPIVLPQEATENCLRELYLSMGGKILGGYEFDAGSNDLNSTATTSPQTMTLVPAKGNSSDASIIVRCQWLLGCDGTHSSVRKALGIDYPGSTVPEQKNYVMDVIVEHWPFETMFTTWFQAADSGLVMQLSHDPLLVRIVGTTERAAQRLLTKFAVRRVLWDSFYISSYRLASTYGRGNVWLAGDACHVHSPLGGRGMNTGIADAIALASAIARNDLSGYEAERRPVARTWVWSNYLLSQIAMGKGAAFYAVRYVAALAIRGLAYLLGPSFAVLSFGTVTTSIVRRKVSLAGYTGTAMDGPGAGQHME